MTPKGGPEIENNKKIVFTLFNNFSFPATFSVKCVNRGASYCDSFQSTCKLVDKQYSLLENVK